MKIYLVGIRDADGSTIYHACLSKETALIRWNELRLQIIKDVSEKIDYFKSKDQEMFCDVYYRILDAMQETDPNKMRGFPHEEPFINEMEAEP